MLGTPTTIQPVTALGKKLVKAGYTVIREVATRPNAMYNFRTGRFYEVLTPGGQTAVFMKQSESAYHVFGEAEWTASGSSIESAHQGGLGDAIGTDAQLKRYSKLVLSAPTSLSKRYDGLYRAQSQVFSQ